MNVCFEILNVDIKNFKTFKSMVFYEIMTLYCWHAIDSQFGAIGFFGWSIWATLP